jgi:mannose/fructose/N-acetylgalactosamine-specific phosphotransferase system component IID
MSDNFDTLFEGKKKGASVATDTAEGTFDTLDDYEKSLDMAEEKARVSYNQSIRNGVAGRLNTIGDVLFWIVVILSILGVFSNAVIAGKLDKHLIPVGIGLGIISGIYAVIFFYIIKTLFNGFAELIQIAHDIRKDMQSK